MVPIREFVTAIERVEAEGTDDEAIVFKVDGQELRALRPTEGQFALLMMAMGRHASDRDQIAGVVDFFFNILDEPSQQYMMERLTSRYNLLPFSTIVDIMQGLVEDWGGHPTRPPSGSTSSRQNGGRKLTGTLQPST